MFAPRKRQQRPRLPFMVRRLRVVQFAIRVWCAGMACWLGLRSLYGWLAVWAGSHVLTGFVDGWVRQGADYPARVDARDGRMCRSVFEQGS